MPAKKTTKKSVAKKTPKSVSDQYEKMRSFKLHKDVMPFTSTQITRQTIYWIILLSIVVVTQLWILKLQMEIATLTELILVP